MYQKQIQRLGMRKDGYLIGAGVVDMNNSIQVIKDINSVTMRSRARKIMKAEQAAKISNINSNRGFQSTKAGRQISSYLKESGAEDYKGANLFKTTKDKFIDRDNLKMGLALDKKNNMRGVLSISSVKGGEEFSTDNY
jgi:hypothetical protein